MSTAISVHLPEHLARQFNSIANGTERSRSFIIRKVLESSVEGFTDLHIAPNRLHDKE